MTDTGDLIAAQLEKRLDTLREAPWGGLQASGFLDLLASPEQGGAGLTLEDLLPVALTLGRRDMDWPVLETMIGRLTESRALAALATAGLMVGAMEHVRDLTVDYAQTRKQFGAPIGSFQAVQQQIAVLVEEVAAAGMAVRIAYRGAPRETPLSQAALASVRAGQAAGTVCAVAHAVHGAIGISHEYPLHRFTARLRRWRRALGPEAEWLRVLGDWAIDSGLPLADLAAFRSSPVAN